MPIPFLPVNYVKDPSDYIDCLKLVADVAGTFTVPADCHKVWLSNDTGGVSFWAVHTLADAVGGAVAAVIPPGSINDGSCAMCNPAGLFVEPGDFISCISADGCIITAEYYA